MKVQSMIGKKLGRVLGFLITTALILVLGLYLGNFLDPPYTSRSLDAIDAFHDLEEDSQDVIVYGSSHAWKGCDTLRMKKKYGLNAYNYANNWQLFNTTLLFLQDSFRTQHPKVVLIETIKVDQMRNDNDLNGEIYYTRAISDFEGKREYLAECFGDKIGNYVSYYFPIALFHDNWDQITEENYKESDPESWEKARGYNGSDSAEPQELPDPWRVRQKKLPKESLKILDKMVALCKENGTEIIFFTVPCVAKNNYADAIADYAEENGCVYLNLMTAMDEMGMDPSTDMQDGDHLNNSGAAKVADYLGSYIKEHYDL